MCTSLRDHFITTALQLMLEQTWKTTPALATVKETFLDYCYEERLLIKALMMKNNENQNNAVAPACFEERCLNRTEPTGCN